MTVSQEERSIFLQGGRGNIAPINKGGMSFAVNVSVMLSWVQAVFQKVICLKKLTDGGNGRLFPEHAAFFDVRPESQQRVIP